MQTTQNQPEENPCVSLPIIHTIGRSIFDPVWAEKEHADVCSELVFVLRGQVTIKTPTDVLTAQDGDTLYVPANMPHRDIFPVGSVFEVYLVQFRWKNEKDLLKKMSLSQLAKSAKNCRRQLSEDFSRLFQDFSSHRELNETILQLRLLEIIYRLAQQTGGSGENTSSVRRHQIMHQAREIILQNFDSQISLDTIAEKLDISSYYLSRIFSEESGFTLCHYITQVRLEKAVQGLRDPRRTIAEIALKTGFNDSHYFSRVFKAHFGCTPKEFRARQNAIAPSARKNAK